MKKNSKVILTSFMSVFMFFQNGLIASANTNIIEKNTNVETLEENITYEIMPRKSFGMTVYATTRYNCNSNSFYTSDGPNIAVSADVLWTCSANQNYTIKMYVVDANANSYNIYTTPKLVFNNYSNEDQRSKILYLGKNKNYKFIIDITGTNLPDKLPISIGIYNYG